MSGMRSEAGLRRTAEKFDWWNPASGTLEQHLETMGQLAEMRPAGLAPLRMCWNLFTDPPVVVANLRPLSVDELCEQVSAAAAAGVDAISVDANFDPSITSVDDWLAVPDRLAPLLAAARRQPDPAPPQPRQLRVVADRPVRSTTATRGSGEEEGAQRVGAGRECVAPQSSSSPGGA